MKKKTSVVSPAVRLIFLCLWNLVATEPRYRDISYMGPMISAPITLSAQSRLICASRCSTRSCVYFTYEAGVCEIHKDAQPTSSPAISRYILQTWDISSWTNVALGKPTLPNVYYDNLSPSRVVDSDEGTQFHSVDTDNPWWSVDLGSPYIIKMIDVLPHTGVPGWFKDIKIFVGSTEVTNGDFSSYTVVGSLPGTWDGNGRLQFVPVQTTGRYVAIQGFSGTEFLNLLDVKVMV